MDDEEYPDRKGTPLAELCREDLTAHSLEALERRIVMLRQEIERTRAEITAKKGARSAADSIFKT